MDSNQFNIIDIYRRYCLIMSETDSDEIARHQSRKSLVHLLTCFELRVRVRNTILGEISWLMSILNIMEDLRDFSCFYNFVFFISLENGQTKCISVSRAVTNWRLVLAGRFKLLDSWCDFVEKNHRHDITEDTWRQVLVFSHFCAEGSLEGYDPKGSWPVLIDDFIEHLNSYNKNPIQSCNIGYSKAMLLKDKFKPFNDSRLKHCLGLKRKRSRISRDMD